MSRPGSSPVRYRLSVIVAAALAALAATTFLQAQAPSGPLPQSDSPLPVRRVVLYKSGVGYFEHLGRIRGDQSVTIAFTSGQLDDVLKSLTALDLDGGRVAGVRYNSEAGLDRRLGDLRLPLGEVTTRAAFLSALRGARVEVRSAASRVTGRLLSVERIDRRGESGPTSMDTVSIVTDTGELQTVALDPGVSVRILEADLNEEVGKYLSLIATVRDQDVRRLSIDTTGTGDRDLFVSYVSEVPVWKATYRLVLPGATGTQKTPLLQGWAIVDNTVGEDWENVQLSLVAGAPQSFVQAISKPYYVQRPVVPLPDRVSLTPQTHQSAVSLSGQAQVSGTVTDSDGGVIPGVTVRVTRSGVAAGQTTTTAAGRYRITGLAPGQYEVTISLAGFRTHVAQNVVVSEGMDTVVNAVLQVGGVEETITVMSQSDLLRTQTPTVAGGRGGGGGRGDGFFSTARPRLDAVEEVALSQQIDAAGSALGDLFEYRITAPVTIRKNQSALVPILSSDVQAEKVSLWNASSGATRALRAVWLTNATGLTLDGGSFSVIEGQAFAGEGLIEPLKAGERRLLSFAIDLGLVLSATSEPVPARVTRVQVSRGLLIRHTEQRQRRVYVARNEDAEARTLVIEHPARAGWTVGGTVAPVESTPSWHRYRVTVEPKASVNVAVEETRPIQTQVALGTITDDLVTLFVNDRVLSPALEAALREVLARKAEIARVAGEIARRQAEVAQIGRDQERVRENMRSLKGSAEERQLLQRYVKQLNDQETRLETLQRETAALTAERARLDADLARFIEGITG